MALPRIMTKALSGLLSTNQWRRDQWVRDMAGQIRPGARVLDVGAGGGPYRHLFGHCEYRTQDFAQLPAELIVEGAYTRVDYVCDAAAIPEAAAHFDVVLCTEVLEHVPEPIAVIREIARLLKPGGLLLLTAPLGSGIHQAPYHFYGGYTPYFYDKVLGECGFGEIRILANGGSFAHFAQWCLWFGKTVLQHLGRGPGLGERLVFLAALPVVIVPLAGLYGVSLVLDRFDRERQFTVGYHVVAQRKG